MAGSWPVERTSDHLTGSTFGHHGSVLASFALQLAFRVEGAAFSGPGEFELFVYLSLYHDGRRAGLLGVFRKDPPFRRRFATCERILKGPHNCCTCQPSFVGSTAHAEAHLGCEGDECEARDLEVRVFELAIFHWQKTRVETAPAARAAALWANPKQGAGVPMGGRSRGGVLPRRMNGLYRVAAAHSEDISAWRQGAYASP